MELLKKLPSPLGLSREEILDILFREEYGYPPEKHTSVTAEVASHNPYFYEEKSSRDVINLTVKAPFGEITFPIIYNKLKRVSGPVPAFIHLGFRMDTPDRFEPTEEILDGGFSIITIPYKEITADNADFTNGLAGLLFPDGNRPADGAGKLILWAWATRAVMDYVLTLPEIDHEHISVVGHSRMGKTALLAGALDPRFFCAISNDSGTCGASLARESTGEPIGEMYPFWVCENFMNYAGKPEELPFDQHYLIAANATHRVYVGSAERDTWACPKNEYLSCVAASEYFRSVGKTGLIAPDRLPEVGECFPEGDIGYHIREGAHLISRNDWNRYMAYVRKHMK